jgi:multiple sugar transport system permease protein
MLVILFATGLPITMLLVPLYQMYVLMGWLDSLFTTSLFLSATSIPFAIWLMKNFIDAVPAELEQAAQLEGTGTATMLRKVVLPLSWPGVIVAAIYTFINAWGAFIVPLVLNTSPNQLPGSIAIYYFLGDQGVVQFGGLAMYSLLFSLPVVVLYLATSRYFEGSFSFGGALRG